MFHVGAATFTELTLCDFQTRVTREKASAVELSDLDFEFQISSLAVVKWVFSGVKGGGGAEYT